MLLRIIRLGWKNVWRNPTRSGVVIIAVVLGTWAGIFISAFFNGMVQDYLQNQLNLSVGHIQVTAPMFEDQMSPEYAIPNAPGLIDTLSHKSYINRIQVQSLTPGLAQSAVNSFGVSIHGIYPESDTLHPIQPYIEQGDLLAGVSRNPVLVGRQLADRLDLKLRSKVVLSFQDVNGNLTAGSFRVASIFDSFNNQYDKSNVFVKAGDLNRILGDENLVHKITLKVDNFSQADRYSEQLSKIYPGLEISSWGVIAPELLYVFSAMDISLYVIMIIIIIALVFSIVNTMLMAILERTRELGMLMAVGMNQARVFTMILSETFFLTMAGAPIGLLFSWGTISYFAGRGINVSAFSEGLNAYGISTMIHPELGAIYYLNITLLIAAAALVSSIYPAWKTLQLKPVEAIHKI